MPTWQASTGSLVSPSVPRSYSRRSKSSCQPSTLSTGHLIWRAPFGYGACMGKQHCVRLTEADRAQLQKLLAAGTATARTLTHARILLKADQGPGGLGWADPAIAAAVEVSVPTIATGPPAVCPGRGSRPPWSAGRRAGNIGASWRAGEAHLIALACGTPPAGYARWSLRLLADRLVELDVSTRSRTRPSAGCSKKRAQALAGEQWCIPPEGQRRVRRADGGRAGVYGEPHDPARPVICMDELQAVARPGRRAGAAGPGRPARDDYEYDAPGDGQRVPVSASRCWAGGAG